MLFAEHVFLNIWRFYGNDKSLQLICLYPKISQGFLLKLKIRKLDNFEIQVYQVHDAFRMLLLFRDETDTQFVQSLRGLR